MKIKTSLKSFDLVYKGCNEYIYIIISNTFLYIYNNTTIDVNHLCKFNTDVNHLGEKNV